MNDAPSLPPILQPRFESMPPELIARSQWVAWVAEWLPDKQKYSKIPYDAKTGRLASSTDPRTWATFAQAKRAYEQSRGKYAGVGFVLWKKPPRPIRDDKETEDVYQQRAKVWESWPESDPFSGVDLDDGTPQQDIDRWVSLLDSYTEWSPSGKGIRIFVIGNLPPGDRKRGTVECYDSGRFLTVTGHLVRQGTK